jgi:hypothetical protein
MGQPAVAQVTIKQLTNDPGGPANNSTANPVTNGFITMFESNRNFNGFNPELNSEIWEHREGSVLIPLTGCELGNSRIPSIGGEIPLPAFTSTCDLAGANADGNAELFFLTGTLEFAQITNTTGLGVLALDIHEFVSTIAFLSDGDLTGQNGDHNVEVFFYTRSDRRIRQLTNTVTGINNSGGISMDPTGTWVTFPSRNDLTGGNPDLNTEVFLIEVGKNAITQITSTTLDGNVSPVVALRNENPVVAFSSTANFAGANPERNQEIFLWDGGIITPVTSTGSSLNDLPSIDDSGTRIAFVSNANDGRKSRPQRRDIRP